MRVERDAIGVRQLATPFARDQVTATFVVALPSPVNHGISSRSCAEISNSSASCVSRPSLRRSARLPRRSRLQTVLAEMAAVAAISSTV